MVGDRMKHPSALLTPDETMQKIAILLGHDDGPPLASGALPPILAG